MNSCPEFSPPEDNCLELVIHGEQDVTAASEQICSFCANQGLDKRTAMLLGLCGEEIADNIVSHGFTKDRKPHSIHVRLVLEKERKILRFRDDCTHFDPVNYVELHRTDKPFLHIGLRMTMGMAGDVEYTNSLGLNNLTFVI